MELTKEYFDQKFSHVVTKEYFDQKFDQVVTKEDFDQKFDQVVTKEDFDKKFSLVLTKEDAKSFATKDDLKNSIRNLEIKVDDGFSRVEDKIEDLARMVSIGFEDVQVRFDVRERVEHHEHVLKQVTHKLGMSMK